MINTRFSELEYKYLSNHIKLSEFKELLSSMFPIKTQECSSWDTYFVKEGTSNEFQRFRESNIPELTKKVKTKDSNNWIRLESDLPLDPNRVTLEKVSFHVGLDGYQFNFRIFKSCVIYWFDDINAVYYNVLDEEMKEIGRFIEIELNKEKVSELGDRASAVLREWEKKLEPLGITSSNRMKKSLFELFVKEQKPCINVPQK